MPNYSHDWLYEHYTTDLENDSYHQSSLAEDQGSGIYDLSLPPKNETHPLPVHQRYSSWGNPFADESRFSQDSVYSNTSTKNVVVAPNHIQSPSATHVRDVSVSGLTATAGAASKRKPILSPINTSPPAIINKVVLSSNKISLFSKSSTSIRKSHHPASPFKITLQTTLQAPAPHTVQSDALRRDQSFESAMENYEVVDLSTGHILSQPPRTRSLRPSPNPDQHQFQPSSSPTERLRGKLSKRCRKTKTGGLSISISSPTTLSPPSSFLTTPSPYTPLPRSACTTLTPGVTSHLTWVSTPTTPPTDQSSTERLLAALRLIHLRSEELIGRWLAVRLRPSFAGLWRGGIGEVFEDVGERDRVWLGTDGRESWGEFEFVR